MKAPKVIISVLSLQNPVMEETVWEQYTVTLQRVSPSVAKHTHTHSHLQWSLYPVHTEGILLVQHAAASSQGPDYRWNRLSAGHPTAAKCTDAADMLLVFNSISIIIFVWRQIHFHHQYFLCRKFWKSLLSLSASQWNAVLIVETTEHKQAQSKWFFF